jgi:hypothetical protein
MPLNRKKRKKKIRMSDEMVVGVNDNVVRMYLGMLGDLLKNVSKLLPGKAKDVALLLVTLTQTDWFVGLVTFVLDKFQGQEVDTNSLNSALQEFASSSQVSQVVSFNKVG